MPRYRYKKVWIGSPKLSSCVEMKRVGDAIAVLGAIGEGELTVEVEAQHEHGVSYRPRSVIDIKNLSGRNEAAVWSLLDLHTDVERARAKPEIGRKVDKTMNGRWPGCPPDILAVFYGLPMDSVFRLRHFAALLYLDLRITKLHFSTSPLECAIAEAQLTEMEITIARRANLNSALRDLLWLR